MPEANLYLGSPHEEGYGHVGWAWMEWGVSAHRCADSGLGEGGSAFVRLQCACWLNRVSFIFTKQIVWTTKVEQQIKVLVPRLRASSSITRTYVVAGDS